MWVLGVCMGREEGFEVVYLCTELQAGRRLVDGLKQ